MEGFGSRGRGRSLPFEVWEEQKDLMNKETEFEQHKVGEVREINFVDDWSWLENKQTKKKAAIITERESEFQILEFTNILIIAAGVSIFFIFSAGIVVQYFCSAGTIVHYILFADKLVQYMIFAGTITQYILSEGTTVQLILSAGTIVQYILSAGTIIQYTLSAGTITKYTLWAGTIVQYITTDKIDQYIV